MTVCAEKNCPNCLPTRKAIANEQEQKVLMERIKREQEQKELWAKKKAELGFKGSPILRDDPYSDMMRAKQRAKEFQRLEAKRQAERQWKAEQNAKFQAEVAAERERLINRRIKYLGDGRGLRIPPQVPEFAEAELVYQPQYDYYNVYWKWDYGDGRKYSFKSKASEEMFIDMDEDVYEVQTADGNIVAKFSAPGEDKPMVDYLDMLKERMVESANVPPIVMAGDHNITYHKSGDKQFMDEWNRRYNERMRRKW
jgi:hypothetical protein